MATIPSIQSGNWSDPSTWDGGVIPGPSDWAQAITGHTVTVDQDVTVQRMTNTGSGKFLLTGPDTRNITCTIVMTLATTATSSLLEIDGDYSGENTVINSGSGAITVNNPGSSVSAIRILPGASGSITLNSGTISVTAGNAHAIHTSGSTDLTINATSLSGSFGGRAFYASGSIGDITISTTSATGFSGGALTINTSAEVTCTITGNFSGGTLNITPYSASYGTAVFHAANADIIINGNIPGGTAVGNWSPNVGLGSIRSLTINGIVSGGFTSGRGWAIDMTAATEVRNITINGAVVGGNSGNAININQPTNLIINGDVRSGDGSTTVSGGPAFSGTASATLDRLITIRGNVFATRNEFRGGSNGAIGNLPSGFAVRVGTPGEVSTIYNSPVEQAITFPFMVVEGAYVRYKYGILNADDSITDLGPVLTDLNSDLSPTDVRVGIVYDDDSKVGSMHVPSPSDVYAGVPIENTIGTASIKLADAATVTGAQISSLGQ